MIAFASDGFSTGHSSPKDRSFRWSRSGGTGKLRPVLARKFGAHMSIAGGCDRAVWAAHAFPFETVQLFTKNNNRWQGIVLTDAQAEAFRSALAQTGIADPVAHTSYLINLASPDDALWEKSIDAMVDEVERCHRLGIGDLVLHPGAHMGEGEEAGLERVGPRAGRGLPADPGDAKSGSTWRRRPARGRAWGTASSIWGRF